MEAFFKALERVFGSPRVAATAFLVCAAVLIGARHVSALAPLAQQYSTWIWALLLVSGFYSLTFPVQSVGRYVRALWQRRTAKTYMRKMSPEEKKWCRWFLENDGDSLHHNPANGAIARLIQSGILWKTEKGWGDLYDFNIRPWALAYIKKHPQLVKE